MSATIELSVSLNDGAIAEAGSSRNFDAVGDDAAFERGARAHTHVVPDDAVGDVRGRFDDRPSPDLQHVAFGLANRQARVEIVRRRSDVPEVGGAQERAHMAEILSDQIFVQGADAFRRLVQGQPCERRRMRHLHADNVIRAHTRPGRHDAVESARGIDDQAAVALGMVVWNDGDRDERAGLAMILGERVQVHVRERVAVDDEKRLVRQQVERFARPAGRAEHRRFERVPDTHAEIAAVSNPRRDRLRQVVKVQHEVADAPVARRTEEAGGRAARRRRARPVSRERRRVAGVACRDQPSE